MKFLTKDGLLYFWQKIVNAFVKKESGKGLSTNDYTTDEKNKLAGIDSQANKTVVDTALNTTSTNPVQNKVVKAALDNKVDSVSGKGLSTNDLTDDLVSKINSASSFSGSYEDLTNKPTIPTNNNQLTNGAGYQTASQVETIITGKGYQTSSDVSTAISTAIAGVTQFNYSIVSSLPTTGVKGTIYLVANSGTNPNIYDEYIYVNDKFEKLGTTDISLDGYVQTGDLEAITNTEIDTIVAS